MSRNNNNEDIPINFAELDIVNPKQTGRRKDGVFPFYAGYSLGFASRLLASAGCDAGTKVLDPWNGSGTTTLASASLGLSAIGTDLNPVMIVVAKSRLLAAAEQASLLPLAEQLLRRADAVSDCTTEDPLLEWVTPKNAAFLRGIERQINAHFVDAAQYRLLGEATVLGALTPLAAFFYVALFRAVRSVLVDCRAANPTWTKKPRPGAMAEIPNESFAAAFIEAVAVNGGQLKADFRSSDATQEVRLADSKNLPFATGSIDFVVTSPPYCTRIDYAVASAIELAILNVRAQEADRIRRSLLGSTTVEKGVADREFDQYGDTCATFLARVREHPSVASSGYYLKSHIAYYDGLRSSIRELARVLRPRGSCVMVIQDSYYKDVHNDVQKVAVEVAESFGMNLQRREDYVASRSLVEVNRAARRYVSRRQNVESVLCFVQSGA